MLSIYYPLRVEWQDCLQPPNWDPNATYYAPTVVSFLCNAERHSCHLVIPHIHPFCAKLLPSLLYFPEQFLVCFRDVVEGEDAISELEQEVGAEGHECPEWYLETA